MVSVSHRHLLAAIYAFKPKFEFKRHINTSCIQMENMEFLQDTLWQEVRQIWCEKNLEVRELFGKRSPISR